MKSNISLRDSRKSYTYDQDKAVSPQETVATVKERFRDAGLDILKQTVRIDSGRLDIPVYISICGADAVQTIGNKKQMGKGATPDQAEASALMELNERYSFFSFLKNRNFQQAAYDDLTDPKMEFERILQSVHHPAEDADRAFKVFRNLPLSWTWGKNLSRGEDVLIPISWFYEINQFNGPAAGNTLEEAVVQGTCEVVERHVCEEVSSRKLVMPSIAPQSVKDEVAVALLEKFYRNGIILYLKDFTSGMGIPTVGALAWDPKSFPHRSEIVFTAGTATDPAKALIRALTEVAQLSGDFATSGTYVASGLPKPASMDEILYITSDAPKVSLSDLPSAANDNFRVEIENCVRALEAKGMELFAVNTTHPVVNVPATYNIIPGCRFRERARASSIPFFVAKITAHTFSPTEGLARLEWMHTLYPDQYYLFFYRGLLEMELDRYDDALLHFRHALQLDPEQEDVPTIQCQVGACYKDMGDFSKAILELEKAAVLDGERKEVFNALGYCYFKEQQHNKSIECFEKAIELDPDSAIDYANIGSNLRELGKMEEAIRFYEMALSLDSSIEFARENARRLRELLKKSEE